MNRRKSDKPAAALREAVANTGAAFALSLASHCLLIAPLLLLYQRHGGDITDAAAGVAVTMYYTALSLARNYLIRRVFCKKQAANVKSQRET